MTVIEEVYTLPVFASVSVAVQ